jgi:hypothetical protein
MAKVIYTAGKGGLPPTMNVHKILKHQQHHFAKNNTNMIHCKNSNKSGVRMIPAILPILLQIMVHASCVKVDLNETNHPGSGKIIRLNTDWTHRADNVAVPDNYTVRIGDYTTTLSGTTNAINRLFAPGAYYIHIWNAVDQITVGGTTATADYGNGLLGWFFTGVADQTVKADRDYTVTVNMRQQVRKLTLVLEPTGDAKDLIPSVTASLSGVAGAIGINTGNPAGNAVSVDLVFAKSDDGKYYVSIRLLGVAGTDQKLAVTLNYSSGNLTAQTIVCDLSRQLAAFNADKKTPLTLNAEAIITPTETGFTATIGDWTETGETIIAE